MQFIPHIEVRRRHERPRVANQVKRQVDSGAVALYVWGVAADELVTWAASTGRQGRGNWRRSHGLPVGVGGHSLQAPMECEKHGVPCDFYVKTLHRDDYPSATPKERRKEFMWLTRGQWVLRQHVVHQSGRDRRLHEERGQALGRLQGAGGRRLPAAAWLFQYAFKNGADFIAVGMLDFQIPENCKSVETGDPPQSEAGTPLAGMKGQLADGGWHWRLASARRKHSQDASATQLLTPAIFAAESSRTGRSSTPDAAPANRKSSASRSRERR